MEPELRQEIKNLKEEADKRDAENEELNQRLCNALDEVDSLKRELDYNQVQFDQVRGELNNCQSLIESLRGVIASKEEQIQILSPPSATPGGTINDGNDHESSRSNGNHSDMNCIKLELSKSKEKLKQKEFQLSSMAEELEEVKRQLEMFQGVNHSLSASEAQHQDVLDEQLVGMKISG